MFKQLPQDTANVMHEKTWVIPIFWNDFFYATAREAWRLQSMRICKLYEFVIYHSVYVLVQIGI